MTPREKAIQLKPNESVAQSPFWWLRWVPAAVCAAVVLYLLYVLGRVALVPLLASFALAYLLNPIVQNFERRGLSPAVAAIFTIAWVMLATVVFLTFVIPDLWAHGEVASQN